jgi:hypothetical protein
LKQDSVFFFFFFLILSLASLDKPFFFFPHDILTNSKQAPENQTLALIIMSQQKKNETPLFFSSPFCSFRNCKREFQNVVLNFVCEFLSFTRFLEFTFHKVLLGVTWHWFFQTFQFEAQQDIFKRCIWWTKVKKISKRRSSFFSQVTLFQ